MVFDPTFQAISDQADELPAVAGSSSDAVLDDIDQDLEGAADSAPDEAHAAESEADAAALAGDVVADDLPPLGED